jgi:hypothetical protein
MTTTISHKTNLISMMLIGIMIGANGWWLAAAALALAIAWRGE